MVYTEFLKQMKKDKRDLPGNAEKYHRHVMQQFCQFVKLLVCQTDALHQYTSVNVQRAFRI